MNSISIIVVYRNREIKRIINFLDSINNQTFKKFELIFLDYGSDESISQTVQECITKYSFVNYYYHDSRGQEWNRSRAINLAISKSRFNHILISDIDLVFHPRYLQHISDISNMQSQIYTRVYMVDKNYTDYSVSIFSQSIQAELSHTSGKGILCVNKQSLLQIGGYDEYYCDWGVEDNDIFIRLSHIGLIETWVDYSLYPVYHQWHPSQDNFTKYPDKWHDDISFHYIKNQNNPLRNTSVPNIIPIDSRPILNILDTNIPEIVIEKVGYLTTKTLYYRNVWNHLITTDIDFFKIIVPKFQIPRLSIIQTVVFNFFSFILKLIQSPFSLQYFQQTERYKYFLPEKDMQWFIRKLIKETDAIVDYYIIEKDTETIYYIQSKISVNK